MEIKYKNYSSELFKSEIGSKFLSSYFINPQIEEKYLSHLIDTMKYLHLSYFILGLLTIIAILIYGMILKFNLIFAIVNSVNVILTIISMIAYYFTKTPYRKSYIQLGSMILINISIITNCLFFYMMELEEFRILRIIYCLILIKNLSLLIWSRIIFIVSVILCLINLGCFVFCICTFKKFKVSIVDEIVLEILVSLVTFYIKKYYDYAMRLNFIERIKFVEHFIYSKKLVNDMNGFHISYCKNNLVYMNDNMKSLVDHLIRDNEINEIKGIINFY